MNDNGHMAAMKVRSEALASHGRISAKKLQGYSRKPAHQRNHGAPRPT